MSAITHWYEVVLKFSVGSIPAASCRRLWPSQGIAVVAEFADKDLHNCILDSRRGSFLLTLFPITLSTVFSDPCSLQCLFSLLPEKMWKEEQKSSNNSILTSYRSYLQLQEWEESIMGGRKWRKKMDKKKHRPCLREEAQAEKTMQINDDQISYLSFLSRAVVP